MGKIKDGILVSDVIIDKDSKNIIITREKVKFNAENEQNYNDKFEQFKLEGIILNENYKDNNWKLEQIYDGKKKRCTICFNFEVKPQQNTVLKFYCLDLITNKISIYNIYQQLTYISKSLLASNFFSLDCYEDFEDFIISLSENEQTKVRDALWNYLSYCQDEIPEEYITFLSGILNAVKNRRILPDYRSILYFDYFMDEFLTECSYDLKVKYYPVILWWKITTCIPMRVTEFITLKKDGFYKKNGKFYMKVKRIKPHSYLERALNITKKQVFRINEEIYNMVMDYTKIEGHDEKYIISYNLFKKFFGVVDIRQDCEALPDENLTQILNEFYYEIIDCKYNFKAWHKDERVDTQTRTVTKITGNNIVKLQLGDTRHLAIINLILSGRNPYTIKELAGHRDINSHIHYGNHIEKYIEAKTIIMTDDIRKRLHQIEKEIIPASIGNRRLEQAKEVLARERDKKDDILHLSGGFCFGYIGRLDRFPNLCIGECKECDNFIRDTNSMDEESLNFELVEIKRKIEREVRSIQFYIFESKKNRLVDNKNGKFNSQSRSILKTASNKLEKLISQKATIEAYSLKLKEVDIEQ